MTHTLIAVFDGETLRPENPVDLKPHTRYRLIIAQELQETEGPNAWDTLDALAGAIEGPEDWAAEHDHYLYGTPKRHGGSNA